VRWIPCLIFRFLLSQVTGEAVGEVRAVSGMHERKAEMARFADAFIALPGIRLFGYSTALFL